MTRASEFIKGIAKETPAFEVNCVGIATTKKGNPIYRSIRSTKAISVDGLPCDTSHLLVVMMYQCIFPTRIDTSMLISQRNERGTNVYKIVFTF